MKPRNWITVNHINLFRVYFRRRFSSVSLRNAYSVRTSLSYLHGSRISIRERWKVSFPQSPPILQNGSQRSRGGRFEEGIGKSHRKMPGKFSYNFLHSPPPPLLPRKCNIKVRFKILIFVFRGTSSAPQADQKAKADVTLVQATESISPLPKCRLGSNKILKGHLNKVNSVHFCGDSR